MKVIKNVTKQDFEAIKQLESYGLSNMQIAKLTRFSTATASRVKAQNTWEDYIVWKKETREKLAKAKADKTNAESEAAFVRWVETDNHRVRAIPAEPLPTDKKVDRVADALERIADVLEKWLEQSKKGWRL